MKVPLTPEQAFDFIKGKLDVDGDLFDHLYTYYTSHERGEDAMPYGTAKARDGDPHQWMEMQLRRDIEADLGMTWVEVERFAELIKDASLLDLSDRSYMSNIKKYDGIVEDVAIAAKEFGLVTGYDDSPMPFDQNDPEAFDDEGYPTYNPAHHHDCGSAAYWQGWYDRENGIELDYSKGGAWVHGWEEMDAAIAGNC